MPTVPMRVHGRRFPMGMALAFMIGVAIGIVITLIGLSLSIWHLT